MTNWFKLPSLTGTIAIYTLQSIQFHVACVVVSFGPGFSCDFL